MYPLSQKENEEIMKKANDDIINKVGQDELRNNWDQCTCSIRRLYEDMKDKLPIYIYLTSKIQTFNKILPWRLNYLFSTITSVYNKLPDEDKAFILQSIRNFLQDQNWELYNDEWEHLSSDLCDWLDLNIKNFSQTELLISHLDKIILDKAIDKAT